MGRVSKAFGENCVLFAFLSLLGQNPRHPRLRKERFNSKFVEVLVHNQLAPKQFLILLAVDWIHELIPAFWCPVYISEKKVCIYPSFWMLASVGVAWADLAGFSIQKVVVDTCTLHPWGKPLFHLFHSKNTMSQIFIWKTGIAAWNYPVFPDVPILYRWVFRGLKYGKCAFLRPQYQVCKIKSNHIHNRIWFGSPAQWYWTDCGNIYLESNSSNEVFFPTVFPVTLQFSPFLFPPRLHLISRRFWHNSQPLALPGSLRNQVHLCGWLLAHWSSTEE